MGFSESSIFQCNLGDKDERGDFIFFTEISKERQRLIKTHILQDPKTNIIDLKYFALLLLLYLKPKPKHCFFIHTKYTHLSPSFWGVWFLVVMEEKKNVRFISPGINSCWVVKLGSIFCVALP